MSGPSPLTAVAEPLSNNKEKLHATAKAAWPAAPRGNMTAEEVGVAALASPPSTAMLLSGLSNYPHEQYVQEHRSHPGKTPMFDVTKEAHDRHGNPVRLNMTGPVQRERLAEAYEMWLKTEKLRKAQAEEEPPMVSEYQAATSNVQASGTQFTPRWVEMDRQVLRFHAYFKEDVENSRIESFRVRKVDMHYYLVDDTLSIEEHREDNSGMEQGSFLSRQKAYHDGTDNQVTPLDLVIGAAIVLFGRTYTIVDADKHTRELLDQLFHIPLAAAQPYPEAPYRPTPTAFSHRPKPTTIGVDVGFEEDRTLGFYHRKPDTLHKFLENDRKVLSFTCVWDDSPRLYGERRELKLNFYLADDTIEINEIPGTSRGRGPFTRMLSRQRVPLPGAATIRTYPWAKDKDVSRQPCSSSVAPRTPPRSFADAICAKGATPRAAGTPPVHPIRLDQHLPPRQRPSSARGRPATAGSAAAGRPTRRPATAQGTSARRSGAGIGAGAGSGAASVASAGQRPRSAPSPALSRPSITAMDDGQYDRRDVNPITGLPTYRPATAAPPTPHSDEYPVEPCCGSDVAKKLIAHPTQDGRAVPSVGAAAAGAGLGAGLHADLPARFVIKPDYYTADKLRCGSTVLIFGRYLLLVDCDEFTRQWFAHNLEVNQTPVPPPTPTRHDALDLELPKGKVIDLRPPTPPKLKMGENPMDKLNRTLSTDTRHLRALVRIQTDDPDQTIRRFILCYYIDDASISMFEPEVINTGHPGGKFLERGFHRNANADVDRADPLLILPQLFRPTDFFVGAEIRFHHSPYQRFEVLDVDTSGSGLITAALKDGVVQSSEPEVSAVDLLLARIAWRLDGRVSSVVKTLEGYDWRVRGGVDADVAFAVFRKLGVSADVVTDEELRMALGHFARPKDGLIQYRELLTRLLDTPVPLLQPRVLFKDAPTPPRTARDQWTRELQRRDRATKAREAAGGPPSGGDFRAGNGFDADSPEFLDSETPVVSEAEKLQRRLRLLLGTVSPKLLKHFFRLQDPSHGGYVGSHCFLVALEQAGMELARTDKAFLMRTLFPTDQACVEYSRLLESLFGPATIAHARS